MTTFTVCMCAHSDVEQGITMQPGYQPLAIETLPTREMADQLVRAWDAEDGDVHLYYISESSRPVTRWY